MSNRNVASGLADRLARDDDMIMNPIQTQWTQSRDALIRAIIELGFPEELGDAIARHLGSPKAIDRMTAYLTYAQPKRAEDVVDEMLAIRSEIDAWKEKKDSQRASGQVNEMLWYGLSVDEEYETEL